MRLEYSIEIDQIDTPRFAVEAVEGIGKLFTLATAVLNMLEAKQKVEVVSMAFIKTAVDKFWIRNGVLFTKSHLLSTSVMKTPSTP
jgi:hypothetical protein